MPQTATVLERGFLKNAILLILGAVALVILSNYVTGALLLAFRPSDSDFAELYSGSWLWRYGQNPYDPALATAARHQIVGGTAPIFLVNVPTSLVLVAPFTLLPWGWGNLTFLIIGMAGLAISIALILRLRGPSRPGLGTALLIVFILAFSPLRIAFQWGNVVILILPLSLLAIELAERARDWPAGLLIGLAFCLKPQIGLWLAVYYLLRGRFKIIASAAAVAVFIAALFFLHPIPLSTLVPSYRANMQHWFAPGGLYGFTEGSVTSVLLRTQGAFFRLTHSIAASNGMAHLLFVAGLVAWALLQWCAAQRIPPSLAIATIWSLSFLSLYHSLPDAAVLLIALCDVFPVSGQAWTRAQRLVCAVLFLIMLPQRSILVFLSRHVSASVATGVFWDLFVARYMVWLLVALSIALLLRMLDCQKNKAHGLSHGR